MTPDLQLHPRTSAEDLLRLLEAADAELTEARLDVAQLRADLEASWAREDRLRGSCDDYAEAVRLHVEAQAIERDTKLRLCAALDEHRAALGRTWQRLEVAVIVAAGGWAAVAGLLWRSWEGS